MTALTTDPVRRPGPLPLFLLGAVIALLAVSALMYAWISAPAAATVGYSQFLTDVEAGGITNVVQTGSVLEVSGSRGTYTVAIPSVLTDVYGDVKTAATQGGAITPQFQAVAEPDNSWIGLVLTGLLPIVGTLLVLALVLVIVSRATRRDGGRSLAQRLRELDEAHASRLIGDEEWQRQRRRILDEA